MFRAPEATLPRRWLHRRRSPGSRRSVDRPSRAPRPPAAWRAGGRSPPSVLRPNCRQPRTAGLVPHALQGERTRARTISLLTALGRLRDRLYQSGIHLGPAVVREQSVLLLLDVGQLRVAEAFDRSRLHQALDQAAVDLQKLAGVPDLGVAPA